MCLRGACRDDGLHGIGWPPSDMEQDGRRNSHLSRKGIWPTASGAVLSRRTPGANGSHVAGSEAKVEHNEHLARSTRCHLLPTGSSHVNEAYKDCLYEDYITRQIVQRACAPRARNQAHRPRRRGRDHPPSGVPSVAAEGSRFGNHSGGWLLSLVGRNCKTRWRGL